jgi:hypothetical protein
MTAVVLGSGAAVPFEQYNCRWMPRERFLKTALSSLPGIHGKFSHRQDLEKWGHFVLQSS